MRFLVFTMFLTSVSLHAGELQDFAVKWIKDFQVEKEYERCRITEVQETSETDNDGNITAMAYNKFYCLDIISSTNTLKDSYEILFIKRKGTISHMINHLGTTYID